MRVHWTSRTPIELECNPRRTPYESPKRTKIEKPAFIANSSFDLAALFDEHIAKEFADFDVDATMETMVAEPYIHCVATVAGGFGGREVRRFYREHFINQIPKDAKVTPIPRTIGKDQVVDELIVSFTPNTQWDYLLPGRDPANR